MNDTALAIPYALKAGLGEYGRHGLVITPEFGPRVGATYTCAAMWPGSFLLFSTP